jgi:hypothetical protein
MNSAQETGPGIKGRFDRRRMMQKIKKQQSNRRALHTHRGDRHLIVTNGHTDVLMNGTRRARTNQVHSLVKQNKVG